MEGSARRKSITVTLLLTSSRKNEKLLDEHRLLYEYFEKEFDGTTIDFLTINDPLNGIAMLRFINGKEFQ
jgi:hypothetical protein